MAKGKQRGSERVSVDGAQPALRQSLAGLAGLRDLLPAGTPPADAAPAGSSPATPAPPPTAGARDAAPRSTVYSRAARVVVRRERKGHGGKTITRIEGLAGSARELDSAVRDVKRGLGCGATLEGSDVLVQGDQSERVRAFLEAHGVRKIVLGN
jgi:translation initiation factor 1